MRRLYAILCAVLCFAIAATPGGQEEQPRTHAEIHKQNGEVLHLLRERVKTHSELLRAVGDAIEEINSRIDASVKVFEIVDEAVRTHDKRIVTLDKRTKDLAAAIKLLLEREQEELEPPTLRRP